MFSQFFVLSLRGDTILHKDCKCSQLFTSDWSTDSLPSCSCLSSASLLSSEGLFDLISEPSIFSYGRLKFYLMGKTWLVLTYLIEKHSFWGRGWSRIKWQSTFFSCRNDRQILTLFHLQLERIWRWSSTRRTTRRKKCSWLKLASKIPSLRTRKASRSPFS